MSVSSERVNQSVEATSDLLDDNFFQISIKKLTTKYAYNEKDLWSLEFRPKRTPLYQEKVVRSYVWKGERCEKV